MAIAQSQAAAIARFRCTKFRLLPKDYCKEDPCNFPCDGATKVRNWPRVDQLLSNSVYKILPWRLSGTGDSQCDSRESIRANHSQLKPYFYSASGRFARITRISDSRESPDSRESCESIRANHATKPGDFVLLSLPRAHTKSGWLEVDQELDMGY